MPPVSFAYPYGDYNASAVSIARSVYLDARTVEPGFIDKTTDPLLLKCFIIDASAIYSATDITKAIDDALASGTWLVLVFQRVDEPASSISVPHQWIQQIVNYLASKGARVVTMSQGAKLLTANRPGS